MWVLGGSGPNTNDVWASSNGTNWTQVTPAAPWSPRYGLGVVVFNNQMWVLGGYVDTSGFDDVWALRGSAVHGFLSQ